MPRASFGGGGAERPRAGCGSSVGVSSRRLRARRRSPPQLRPQRPRSPSGEARAASAAAAATRGRSRRPPAATARRGGLVSCGSCAAAAATRGRRRRAPCTPAVAPGAPTRARPRAFAAARAARGSGRSRTPTTPASLPAGRTRTLGYRVRAGSGGFGLERGGRERLTGLALRRARAAREHLGHDVVRLVVLVPRAARGVPLHPARAARARAACPP